MCYILFVLYVRSWVRAKKHQGKVTNFEVRLREGERTSIALHSGYSVEKQNFVLLSCSTMRHWLTVQSANERTRANTVYFQVIYKYLSQSVWLSAAEYNVRRKTGSSSKCGWPLIKVMNTSPPHEKLFSLHQYILRIPSFVCLRLLRAALSSPAYVAREGREGKRGGSNEKKCRGILLLPRLLHSKKEGRKETLLSFLPILSRNPICQKGKNLSSSFLSFFLFSSPRLSLDSIFRALKIFRLLRR